MKLLLVGKDAPHVEFHLEPGSIGVNVSDGHMYIEDSDYCSFTESPLTFGVTAEGIKRLELALREWHTDNILLEFDGPQMYVEDMNFAAFVTPPQLPQHDLLDKRNWGQPITGGTVDPFAIMGDRFRKLSLIKPGISPVDFKLVFHTGLKQDLLVFKAGPTVQGALSLIDRKIFAEEVDSQGCYW